MKALIRKELRENFKWGVLGFLVWTAVLFIAARSYSMLLRDLEPSRIEGLQPLNSLSEQAGWLCSILGLLLGWFQIHNETHHELWAFLVHRPVTRNKIFLAKIIAGLSLYLLAAGLPLLGFVVWVATPGHVAAPFEWSMVLPVASHFLAGLVYYFAGMLTALRKARWYASRGLGIGVALISSGSVVAVDRPWDFFIVFVCLAILALAVWGAFHSSGHYETQPRPGKLALIGTLTIGAAVVLFGLATGLLDTLISNGSFSWSNYVMTKDGVVYKQIQRAGQPAEIVDLNGNRATDPKTGRTVGPNEFNRRVANSLWANRYPDKRARSISQRDRWFTYWGENSGTLWYFWNRYGQLVGYDRMTRRFIGSLGANGFAPGLSTAADPFMMPAYHYAQGFSRTLATTSALYELDLDNRATRVLLRTASDDPIEAFNDLVLTMHDWNALVVTRHFVHLLSTDGSVVLKEPYEPLRSRQTDIRVFFLEPPGRFALWIAPGFTANAGPEKSPPTQVTWIERNQGVTKRAELPPLPWQNPTPRVWEISMSSVVPPGLVVALRIFTAPDSAAQIEARIILISFATAALICVPIGWWFALRYKFSRATRFGWAAFLLLSGVPGLLAFLSVHDWPARVPCPNCKKPRAVDLDQCPHCGSEFPAPEKTGIEIFEPLATQ